MFGLSYGRSATASPYHYFVHFSPPGGRAQHPGGRAQDPQWPRAAPAFGGFPALSIGLSQFMSFGCPHSRFSMLEDQYHIVMGKSRHFLAHGLISSGPSL